MEYGLSAINESNPFNLHPSISKNVSKIHRRHHVLGDKANEKYQTGVKMTTFKNRSLGAVGSQQRMALQNIQLAHRVNLMRNMIIGFFRRN